MLFTEPRKIALKCIIVLCNDIVPGLFAHFPFRPESFRLLSCSSPGRLDQSYYLDYMCPIKVLNTYICVWHAFSAK